MDLHLNAKFFKLIQAAGRNDIDAVSGFLKDPEVDPSADSNALILTACGYNHAELAKFLLQDNRIDPSDQNNRCIDEAVTRGHLKIVELLMKDKRVDPNPRLDYIAGAITTYNRVEIARILFSDKNHQDSREIFYPGVHCLRWAVLHEHADLVEMCLDHPKTDLTINSFVIDSITDYMSHNDNEITKMLLSWRGPLGEQLKVAV